MVLSLSKVALAAGINPKQSKKQLFQDLQNFWFLTREFAVGTNLTGVCKSIALLNWVTRVTPDIGKQFRGVVNSVISWNRDQKILKKADSVIEINAFFYDRGEFACHLDGSIKNKIKQALAIINNCLLRIETVYTELLEANDQEQFLRNYVEQYENLKKFRPCIEGSCEAFTDALSLVKNDIEPFKFDALLTKYQNLGNAGNYFRKISCKKCVGWDDIPYCFSFEFKYLPAFLLEKVGGKKSSDGVINHSDIQKFIDGFAEDLYECKNISKEIDLEVGEYPTIHYVWDLPADIKKQINVLADL